ncbi:MAG: hypothetical protein KDF64_15045 [Geminicoccaceae bacterium]|nr:hypothetical protein [Geminicoccaceae bacterium]
MERKAVMNGKTTSLLPAFLACFVLVMLPDRVLAEGESNARSWGLSEEQPAVIRGRVVDIFCEIAGECPDDCGGGGRQLGLLTEDGRLVAVAKNGQPLFNGAIADLLPYCGVDVEADGLMTGNGTTRYFQVQLIREQGASRWNKATLWTEMRARSEPPLIPGEGPWFRRDPRILGRIERDGYLGLGKEVDDTFIAEW